MPLCPQITITPITVTTTGMTQSSIVPIVKATTEEVDAVESTANAAAAAAAAAAATAGAAQSTANTALANALTAYNAAVASLQPSANTIVNAQNQMTAIAANGITVFSGASSTSGARVVLNSLGLAGFDGSNNATFSISATTGAAVFSGSVTGSTITGGSLNIAGNAIIDASGLLTATGATITGTINATAGYFGTSTNGFSINSTGMIGIGGGEIVGGSVRTSTGNRQVVLSGSNNAIAFKEGGNNIGWVGPASFSGVQMHYGSTFSPSATAYPHSYVSSSSAEMAYSSGIYVEVSSTGVVNNGNVYNLDATYIQDVSTTSNVGNARIDSADGRLRRSTASSARYKEEIVSLSTVAALDPNKLLSIPTRAFKFKSDYLDADDIRAGVLVPGLIAEEVAEHYPIAADTAGGVVENWSERFLLPGMLALIQDLHARVATLEGE